MKRKEKPIMTAFWIALVYGDGVSLWVKSMISALAGGMCLFVWIKCVERFYENNAGDFLIHDACDAPFSGVKDGALGDEAGGREVVAYRKFLDTQAYSR